jgi:N-acetylglucosaminyl-diphospho-decaprenol L-rhamnosyltransferase
LDREEGPGGRPEVSVAVVHYETPGVLEICLRALGASTIASSLEVFVVDNASKSFDRIAAERALPGITVVQNPTNVGFGRASNQALKRATGRYLLLLNPDAEVEPRALETMTEYMDAHPDVGCATARLVLPNGRLDLACRRSFPTPMRAFYRMTFLSRLFPRSRQFGQYNLTYMDEHTECEIDAACGAFMMVRAEVLESVGLLDERYFMYGEDIDWAFRMKAAGWRVMYVPQATVHHLKRASSRSWRPQTIRHFHEAMRIFYREHYESRYPRWVSTLMYAAINVREGVELAGNRLRRLTGS